MTSPRRNTKQRDTILHVIEEARGPLSVQEILDHAQKSLPKLGIATVYRTLRMLQDDHQIKTVILPSGENRFEKANLGHHHHFQCLKCGEVVDLDLCPLNIPTGSLLPGGYTVEAHELTLYGTCPKCRGLVAS